MATNATQKKAVAKPAPAKPVAKAPAKTAVKAPAKVAPRPASKPAPKSAVKPAPKTAVKPVASKGAVNNPPYISDGEIEVKLVRGLQGCTEKQLRTVEALGLKKTNDVKLHKDNPAIRGMCNVVAHLVKVTKVS